MLEESTKQLRYITSTEIERLMGYPRDYTNVVARGAKRKTEKETAKETEKGKKQEQEKVVETPV